MSPVKPSEFDVGLLTFVPPNKFKPANGGAIIAFKYDGEDGLELKIPAGRVSFDCDFSGKEKDAKSKKLGLSVELPRSPEFEAIRDVLSKADKKFQKYLHDEADNISSALGPKNSTKDKLRTSNNFFGLLRAAKNPKNMIFKQERVKSARTGTTSDRAKQASRREISNSGQGSRRRERAQRG